MDRPLSLLLLACLTCPPALADPPHPGHRLVTDPAEMAAWDTAPGGELWLLADARAATPGERAERARQHELAAFNPAVNAGRWFHVQATEFLNVNASHGYSTRGELMFTLSGAGALDALANVDLPEDRRLSWMDVWGVDSHPTASLAVSLWRRCTDDTGAVSTVQLASASSGAAFAGGAFFSDVPVVHPQGIAQHEHCVHYLRLFVTAANLGESIALLRVRLE
ncbi:MAG: hypothetical protein KF823_12615 [Xanthomonadales bacterium]|nr:hypothetical protein [Xanthomonadales bacterium]